MLIELTKAVIAAGWLPTETEIAVGLLADLPRCARCLISWVARLAEDRRTNDRGGKHESSNRLFHQNTPRMFIDQPLGRCVELHTPPAASTLMFKLISIGLSGALTLTHPPARPVAHQRADQER